MAFTKIITAFTPFLLANLVKKIKVSIGAEADVYCFFILPL